MEKRVYHYPYIVTLALDENDLAWFTALRKANFPNHANYLDAHLTLFHHLPSHENQIRDILQYHSRRAPVSLNVAEVFSFGKGVAFRIESECLQNLHLNLQDELRPWLKRQDQKILRPHITIQNKVTAFKAQNLLQALQQNFTPFKIKAIGFSVWYYIGGPWKAAEFYPFEE